MALGSGQSDFKTYYLKIKGTKKGETGPVVFEASTKVGEKKYEKTDVPSVEGRLKKIEERSYEHEGKTNRGYSLVLEDSMAKERYVLKANYSNLSVGILNSLASITDPGNIKIFLYRNDKGYAGASVQNNGEKTNWKYEPKVLAEKVEVAKNKKGEVLGIDTTERDEFMDRIVIPEIAKHIISSDPVAAFESQKGVGVVDEVSDMPF